MLVGKVAGEWRPHVFCARRCGRIFGLGLLFHAAPLGCVADAALVLCRYGMLNALGIASDRLRERRRRGLLDLPSATKCTLQRTIAGFGGGLAHSSAYISLASA
jgi:hypothetical protein